MAANTMSTFLLISYGLTVVAYLARFGGGLPKFSIFLGMVLVVGAYSAMFVGALLKHGGDGGDGSDGSGDNKKEKDKNDLAKRFTIAGYIVAAVFFFAIHVFPSLTFRVRFYDIFGALGYGLAAIGKAVVPLMLPIGYGIIVLYYVFGSFQKLKDRDKDWINRLQLISRTALAVLYGVSAIPVV